MADTAGWWVYMIEASDGSLYTGITTDPERRWQQHCNGQGAKYLRARPPRALRWLEPAGDRSSASQREAAVKKLPRAAKLTLIAQEGNLSLQPPWNQLRRSP